VAIELVAPTIADCRLQIEDWECRLVIEDWADGASRHPRQSPIFNPTMSINNLQSTINNGGVFQCATEASH
jgi:hypothetical protein